MSDSIKTEALGVGIDFDWVKEIVFRWGEKTLETVTALIKLGFDQDFLIKVLQSGGAQLIHLILDAVKNGFGKDWVIKFFTAFGPAILQFILDVYSKMSQKGFADFESSTNAQGFIEDLMRKWMPTIIKEYVPPVLIAHSQELSEMIIDITKNFMKNQPIPPR
jgi:hypothetical protein